MDIEKEGTPDGREQRKNTVKLMYIEMKGKREREVKKCDNGEHTLKNKSTNHKAREAIFY